MGGFSGSRIRFLREVKNWSQTELAERSGVSRSYLSQLENELKDPTASILDKLSSALQVPVNMFFEDTNLLPVHSLLDLLPTHIREFLNQQEGLPYLELAVKAKDFQITPEELAQLIDILGRKATAAKK